MRHGIKQHWSEKRPALWVLTMFGLSVVLPLVLAVLVALLFGAGGCAADEAQRQLCYATAEADALQDVKLSCADKDIAWDECPDHDRILGTLQQSYRGCK